MGYQIPVDAPKITLPDGRQFAAAAWMFNNPVGSFYTCGIYENVPEQGSPSWQSRGNAVQYTNSGDLLRDIQAKGGRVKYLAWLIAAINKCFADLFHAAPPLPPTQEPATDEEAQAAITAAVNALKLTHVNGVPVLG